MDDLKKLRELAINATLGKWEIQTGNSWRRIGCKGDGDVLQPTRHPHDGHPDLSGPYANLEYIVAACPSVILSLLDRVEKAEAYAKRYAWLRDQAGWHGIERVWWDDGDLDDNIDAQLDQQEKQ